MRVGLSAHDEVREVSADDLRVPGAVGRQQQSALVSGEQVAVRAGSPRAGDGLHPRLSAPAEADFALLCGQRPARWGLAHAGLPRHAIRQGRRSVQDKRRHPVPARAGPRHPCPRLLRPHRAGRVLPGRGVMASRPARARPDPAGDRRVAGPLAPGARRAEVLPAVLAGRRQPQTSAARLPGRSSFDRGPQADGLHRARRAGGAGRSRRGFLNHVAASFAASRPFMRFLCDAAKVAF